MASVLLYARHNSDAYWQLPVRERMEQSAVHYSVVAARDRAPSEQPLSLAAVFAGREEITLDSQRLVVDDDCYLALNHGRRAGSRLRGEPQARAIHVYFSWTLASQTLAALTLPSDQLLELPDNGLPVRFFDQLHPHDHSISPVLRYIMCTCASDFGDPDWYQEHLILLLERLLLRHRADGAEMRALSAIKRSTRAELYRRLTRAKDFVLSCYDRPISIREIADRACMSVPHFHLLFKSCYNISPYRYLQQKRVAVARRLLDADVPVADVASRIGIDSRSTFLRVFRRVTGMSPHRYRQKAQRLPGRGRVADLEPGGGHDASAAARHASF